jgi:hypothetical protein
MRNALQFKGTDQLTPISGKLSRKNEKRDQNPFFGRPLPVFLASATFISRLNRSEYPCGLRI